MVEPRMNLSSLWTKIKTRLFAKTAEKAAEKAAHQILDDLETALLGEVGASDDVLSKAATDDPLERIRAQHGLSDTAPHGHTPAAPPTFDAQAELERHKAEKGRL